MDWGPEFTAHSNLALTDRSRAGIFVDLGSLGLRYILEAGGSGYFRLNVIRRHLKSGRLHLVPGAAELAYPAYAIYSESADAKIVTPALAGLRHIATSGLNDRVRPKTRKPAASRRKTSSPRRPVTG